MRKGQICLLITTQIKNNINKTKINQSNSVNLTQRNATFDWTVSVNFTNIKRVLLTCWFEQNQTGPKDTSAMETCCDSIELDAVKTYSPPAGRGFSRTCSKAYTAASCHA